jgi:outer membrane biogenesis lipoprotein LolB
MRSTSMLFALVLSVASLLLSACAQQKHHDTAPNDAAPAASSAMSQGSKMDHATMCGIYTKMTAEEKRAMMEAHHGKTSPEMLQRHDEMMRKQCTMPVPQR